MKQAPGIRCQPLVFKAAIKLFIVFLSAVCSLRPAACYAADIQFEVTTDREVVSLGESLQLNLSVRGTQNVPVPDIGEIKGFQVRYLGPSTRMSVVNGRVSSSITHIYTLIPLKTGKFNIGPFSVVIGGKTFTSKGLTVEVVSGPSPPAKRIQQSASGRESASDEQLKERIFLTIEAGKSRFFVNEAVPVSVKLYINRLKVKDIQYPKLEHEGFVIKEFGQPKQYRQTVGGIVYDVIEFTTSVFAVKPGEFSLGPAQVDCSLMVRGRQKRRKILSDDDFFGSFFGKDVFDDFFGRYQIYPFQALSSSLAVDVRPLPSEGRPHSFRGAIGDFQFQTEVSPKKVRVGDPITVKMEVSGTGNFDTVFSPVLESKEGFKVYEPQVKEGQAVKVFEQVLIPQSEKTKEIPKTTFSFFNPRTKKYRSLTQGPFPVSVIKAERGGELKIVESSRPAVNSDSEECSGRDIVYIKELPGKFKPTGRYLFKNIGFWLYHLGVSIIFIALAIFYKHREKLKTDKRYARFLRAPERARKGILAAQKFLRQEKSAEFFDAIHKTLTGYLADKLHLPAGRVTISAVKEVLGAKITDEKILDKLASIFSACDMARYAPLEFGRSKREAVFKDTRETIDYLERKKI